MDIVSLVRRALRGAADAVISMSLLRRLLIVCWHIIGAAVTYELAFQLRFDWSVPYGYEIMFFNTLPTFVIAVPVVFTVFGFHSGLWSYVSTDDITRLGAGLAAAMLTSAGAVFVQLGMSMEGFPRSIFVVEFLLLGVWVGGSRVVARYVRERVGFVTKAGDRDKERILVVGQIRDADLFIRAARQSLSGPVVAIVTDEKARFGLKLHGIRISGPVAEVARIVLSSGANTIVILPPCNLPSEIRHIVDACSSLERRCAFRVVPSMADLASGRLTASSIRSVDIEDLIARKPVRMDREDVRAFLKGRRVLVTGAGGSIGSELSRQAAAYQPGILVLFESSEFALYSIEYEIRRQYPNLKVLAVAGDIRHEEEISAAIDSAGGIDVIYHCAAYKHVPLMEENVPACFRTNVMGTERLSRVAVAKKVARFVMVSSDKAVRPSSIMGATKRMAERIISEMPQETTTFVSVRFGNVLESSGSVVPLFKKQIAAGGPVTVTTPEVRRFFMTVSEAVDLVLKAGVVGRQGEVMVLQMGEPIKVLDLARRLIELSGLIPDRDIKIVFTGLRPGEKEYEEVMTSDEDVIPTSNESIWLLTKKPGGGGLRPVDVAVIRGLVEKNDVAGLRRMAESCVVDNTFHGDPGSPSRVPETKR